MTQLRRARFWFRLGMVASLVTPVTMEAQGDLAQADQSRPRFMQPVPGRAVLQEVDAARVPVLRRRVSLDRAGTTLGELLQEIGRQSGLKFAYNADVIPVDRVVGLRAASITVGAALTEILLDTQVDVLLKSPTQAVLLRRGAVRQNGTVTGRVTDAKTGAPIKGAQVFLERTKWDATTDSAGRYRLVDVDTGTYTLTARRIGYAKQNRNVTVGADQETTVDVALEPQATRLDELVTTATGERRRRDVPNDITRIDVDSVLRTQPIRSVTDILEGRVPGLSVQRTSGAPGDPSRLRLRGASSPLLSNDPIVLVDGIRVYAEQSAARSANLAATDYAAPSPLDYIDPSLIETIEVVKGASAATLYGQDAANGVIVITTKKGRAGPTRWSMNVEHGVTNMAAKYPERVLRWGHTTDDHALVACPLGNIYFSSPPPSAVIGTCAPDSIVHFQMLNEPDLTPFGTGRRTAASLSATGGVRTLTYSVTGSYSNELGLLRLPEIEIARYQDRLGRTPPDWMQRPQSFTRWTVASQLGAQLGPTANLTFNATVSQSDQQRSALENQLADLDATYFDRVSGRYYEILGIGNLFPGGMITSGDHTLDNYYTKVTAGATNLTTGMALKWQPRPWLTADANAGVNIVQRSDVLFLPRGIASNSDSTGTLSDGQGRTLVHTLDLRATTKHPLGRGFVLQFATGAQYASTATRDMQVGTRYLPPGKEVPGDSLVGRPGRTVSDLATFGWYVAPMITHPRFAADLGLRFDGGSSYGRGLALPTFPKLGGTWLVSDEPFFPFKTLFSSVRIRAAYGRASRQPGPTDRLRLYGAPHAVPIDGQEVPITALETLGNTQLRPERTSELEGGIEADLFDSRLSIVLTGSRKTTTDALLTTPVPLSIGIGSIVRNIGVTRNTGLDLDLTAQLVRSAPMTWTTRLFMSQRRDEVVRLGPGMEPFSIGGGSFIGGQQRVVPGYPLFGYWAKPVVGYTDLDQDGLIENNEVVISDTAVYRGSPLPDYQATLSNAISLWQGAVRLTADLVHDHGMTQHLDESLIQRQVGLSAGRNDPAASPAEQALVASVPSGGGSGTAYYWYQQVSTTRLNAVSVSYVVPRTLARRVGAERLQISLQGSNLGVWSNYRGVDPNVNGHSTGNLTVDAGQLPQPRTWQLQINATY